VFVPYLDKQFKIITMTQVLLASPFVPFVVAL